MGGISHDERDVDEEQVNDPSRPNAYSALEIALPLFEGQEESNAVHQTATCVLNLL